MSGDIALDIEGVLADVHPPFIEAVNQDYEQELKENGDYPLEKSDIDDFISWGRKISDLGLETKECLEIKDRAWKNNPTDIPLLQSDPEGLREVLEELNERYEMDLVTDLRERENVEKWLEKYQILPDRHYRNFIEERDKVGLGYDLYIEDNPLIVPELNDYQGGIIIPHPYNSDIEESDTPFVRRIDSVGFKEVKNQAYDFLG